jgi:hypothetical protein
MHRVRVANCRHSERKCVRKKKNGKVGETRGKGSSVSSARSTPVWSCTPALNFFSYPERAGDTLDQVGVVHRHSGRHSGISSEEGTARVEHIVSAHGAVGHHEPLSSVICSVLLPNCWLVCVWREEENVRCCVYGEKKRM